MIECLLIIDFPDERSGFRREFDHIHSWGTRDEMHSLMRKLDARVPGHHLIVDGRACPYCGVSREEGEPEWASADADEHAT